MKTGSRVYIIGGTHKDMQGKIVAWSDPNASIKQQKKTMGEQVDEDIDTEAYVSVELDVNHEIVNVRRKRLILQSERD